MDSILVYIYEHLIVFLQDTLHNYLGLMLAVQSAFSDRSSALLTVQTLTTDLASLQAREEKLESSSARFVDKSKLRRIEELKKTIRITEDAKICAIKEYERIKVMSGVAYISVQSQIKFASSFNVNINYFSSSHSSQNI